MSQAYTLAINELYKALGLDQPNEVEEVISLQVGEMVCHLTEHPADSLLMFSSLGAVTDFDVSLLLNNNMFSQELQKPEVAIDETSGNVILWNRQPLLNAYGQSLYRQLELLSQACDRLTGVESANTALAAEASSETQSQSEFSPTSFRV
ncbi:CesT family type III secretion system chaperone (plasmid) [Photobacterium damselae subsp. piscicida]|uniref:CesT family type III secretion system chaperone n=1 Tax=Photobacterium damsela subsp. piscicida TaxID=38294 RepID=A0A1V1VGU6_PHODP|nr:CesT family type III secretion system chaperone [Photobacterium damselae]MDP2516827.1 CesT family type III secretion system chaperone [Photobacterium damselae subsp. piscicida]QOD55121.1 CesT family type III secretion system chaperone [Photobacterium damselae subsp. piscicida]QOD58946.1 CesT family type III secretion system chaperone [Photobacterium damselae subsp. piscicida]GAW47350.1 YopE regulator [Photobacterium damselae subsp. piscicida]